MGSRVEERRAHALACVRLVAQRRGLAGIVLTRPSSVAWASAGMNPPIDRTAAIDTVWLAVTADSYAVITTTVERPRLVAELVPADVEVIEVDWFDSEAMSRAAADVIGVAPAALGSDGHPDFGVDVTDDLVEIRLPLGTAETDDLIDLAGDATAALEGALRTWSPGETDYEVAARISAGIEAVGGDTPCLLVGGDSRLARFRHPVPSGDRPTKTLMAVVVARRQGLHVALTRFVTCEPRADFFKGIESVHVIHARTLDAVQPGATFGDAMIALDAAYSAAGYPNEWRYHYQGGPIGYGQREFEIAPSQRDSRWWNQPIAPGTALAYNPSLPGGFKDEDTYIVQPDGSLRWITMSADWPTSDVSGRPRPSVLIVD